MGYITPFIGAGFPILILPEKAGPTFLYDLISSSKIDETPPTPIVSQSGHRRFSLDENRAVYRIRVIFFVIQETETTEQGRALISLTSDVASPDGMATWIFLAPTMKPTLASEFLPPHTRIVSLQLGLRVAGAAVVRTIQVEIVPRLRMKRGLIDPNLPGCYSSGHLIPPPPP